MNLKNKPHPLLPWNYKQIMSWLKSKFSFYLYFWKLFCILIIHIHQTKCWVFSLLCEENGRDIDGNEPTSRDVTLLKNENRKLYEENNLLKIKVDILLDMVGRSTRLTLPQIVFILEWVSDETFLPGPSAYCYWLTKSSFMSR